MGKKNLIDVWLARIELANGSTAEVLTTTPQYNYVKNQSFVNPSYVPEAILLAPIGKLELL